MNSCCKNCDFARHTTHEEKVGCAYWSVKYYQEKGESISEEKRNSDMFLSGLQQIWLGWVYLQRRPEKKESEFFGEGMMTNYCVITGENERCIKYLERN